MDATRWVIVRHVEAAVWYVQRTIGGKVQQFEASNGRTRFFRSRWSARHIARDLNTQRIAP